MLVSQDIHEVLKNPTAFEYETVKSSMMEASMSLVIKNPDSAFQIIDKLIDHSKSLGLKNETSINLQAKGETLFMLGKYQQALDYFHQSIPYNEDSENLSRLYIRIGTGHQFLGLIDSSKFYLNKGISLVEEIKDTTFFFRTEFLKGDMAFEDEKYISALDHYQKADEYAKFARSKGTIKIESLQRQARTYGVLDNIDQAIDYSSAAQALIESEGLKTYSCKNQISLATFQLKAEKYSDAISNFKLAKKCFTDRDLPSYEIILHTGLAYAYLKTWNLSAAENNLNLAKGFLDRIETDDHRLAYFLNVARFNIVKGEWETANTNLNTSLTLAQNTNEAADRLSVLQVLIELEKARGDDAKTLQFTEAYHHLKDSLFNLMQTNLAIDYESRFNKREQEKSIAELNMVNDVYALKLEQQQKQIYWTSFLILGLSLLLYTAYRAYTNKKKNEALLNQKNKEISKALENNQMLLKEIHHRVKNNLQVVSSLLNLQSRQITDPKAKATIKSGQDRIKSMALIHQNLHQGEDMVGVSARTYIEDLVNGLSKSYRLNSENIEITTKIQDLSIEIDKVIPIGLIINELVSNALKYAFDEKDEGQILVELYTEDNQIFLKVKDTGKGFQEDFDINNLKSLGFKIVSSFTRKLKGKINFPKTSKGAEVTVSFPFQ